MEQIIFIVTMKTTTWELNTAWGFVYTLTHITFGDGDGTPLQYSCLENPMDGGAC